MSCIFCKCGVDGLLKIHDFDICTDCFITYKALSEFDKDDSDEDTDGEKDDDFFQYNVQNPDQTKKMFSEVIEELEDFFESKKQKNYYFCSVQ